MGFAVGRMWEFTTQADIMNESIMRYGGAPGSAGDSSEGPDVGISRPLLLQF